MAASSTADQKLEFIQHETVRVPKAQLDGVPHRLSLDNGATLTKILSVAEADKDHFDLHFITTYRHQLEAALRWVKDNANSMRCDGTEEVKITGVFCSVDQLLQQLFNAKPDHVIELLTQVRGCHWMVNSLSPEQAFLPVQQLEELFAVKLDNELMKNIADKLKLDADSSKASQKFPAILVHLGSGTMISVLNESGVLDSFHFGVLSGKVLQGMAAIMVGTNDYDEIFDLAERGKRAGVDLLIGEVIADDPTSPYGRFNPELPMMHFGKTAEGKLQPKDAKKEDVARSLVSLFSWNLFSTVASIAKSTGVSQVYFAGNYFRRSLARIEFENIKSLLMPQGGFQHHYLRAGGHVGAAGALVANNADAPAYLKFA